MILLSKKKSTKNLADRTDIGACNSYSFYSLNLFRIPYINKVYDDIVPQPVVGPSLGIDSP